LLFFPSAKYAAVLVSNRNTCHIVCLRYFLADELLLRSQPIVANAPSRVWLFTRCTRFSLYDVSRGLRWQRNSLRINNSASTNRLHAFGDFHTNGHGNARPAKRQTTRGANHPAHTNGD
jgi:hypothetical protein